jgi:hypothetical protein
MGLEVSPWISNKDRLKIRDISGPRRNVKDPKRRNNSDLSNLGKASRGVESRLQPSLPLACPLRSPLSTPK